MNNFRNLSKSPHKHINTQDQLSKTRNLSLLNLSAALIFTLIYACLKNPFMYTFSKIGNYFGYRGLYIIWGIFISFSFQFSALQLFKLTHFNKRYSHIALSMASFFLIITTLIPSIHDKWLILHIVHKWTTFFYVMSMILALHVFFVFLARELPQLSKLLRNWQVLILIGCISSLLIQGQTGIFELWFYLGLGSLLIYLTWTLFTDKLRRLSKREQRKKT